MERAIPERCQAQREPKSLRKEIRAWQQTDQCKPLSLLQPSLGRHHREEEKVMEEEEEEEEEEGLERPVLPPCRETKCRNAGAEG
ncbi:hypothetical protein DUI87_14321 [Hirundo rustica rustica]|uniref:Uncharacterized protein n=1 Tax=Hirundo rustica rustica TaxID=333673 RepID=A0A3M0K7Y4_HIRRU|nr:hypothetical protein DUI87_14321 [Hirundo rustica rustica]